VEKLVEWRLSGETEVVGEKTCPSATLSTINLTWRDPALNSDRRGGKPATNRLSYGLAYNKVLIKTGEHNRSSKVAVQGWFLWSTPYTYIIILKRLNFFCRWCLRLLWNRMWRTAVSLRDV
jgi:hypothetical protein